MSRESDRGRVGGSMREDADNAIGGRALAAILALDGGAPGLLTAPDTTAGAPEAPTSRLEGAWAALAADAPQGDAELARLEKDARQGGDAPLVVEVASVRALSSAHAGDVEGALELARRAARMGGAEQLPEPEYLAGLSLARLRRLTGRPYLAARIALALRRVVPGRWEPWVDWEVAMASGRTTSTAPAPAAALVAALDHARAGRREPFDAAIDSIQSRLGGLAFAARDVRCVHAALDPEAALDGADAALVRWCRGAAPYAPAPHGLAGLVAEELRRDATVGVGLVVAFPNAPGRRVLRAAHGLADRAAHGRWLGGGTPGRSEAIISALALRGPDGATDADLFADAYGFSFSSALHRGAFDVALHRARARVDSLGRIERDDGRISLHATHPFVVADPRSVPGTDDRLLAHLASGGELSARHLASDLGVPLRTVQDALRGLVEGGACRRTRAGRQILYAIEDTTFREPTAARREQAGGRPR